MKRFIITLILFSIVSLCFLSCYGQVAPDTYRFKVETSDHYYYINFYRYINNGIMFTCNNQTINIYGTYTVTEFDNPVYVLYQSGAK